MLFQLQMFRITCENSYKFLLERKILTNYEEKRKKIVDLLHELMQGSVKVEEKTNKFEEISLDMPENDPIVEVKLESIDNDSQFSSNEGSSVKKYSSKIEFCPLCNQYFPSHSSDKITFTSHITQVHSTKKGSSSVRCKHCDGSYSHIKHFQRHFRKCHVASNKILMCQFCPQTFFNKTLFFSHLRKDHTSLASRYTCDICQKTYKRKCAIRRHVLIHIQTNTCKNCNKTFYGKREFQNHRRECGDRFLCHFCSCIMLSKFSLENHIKQKHLSSPPCEFCGKTFARRMDLVHHVKITHTQKTKICEQCGKSFFTQHGLESHIKYTHEKQENTYKKKRFWCEVCQKFESHTTKNAHELKIKYGKRFKCDLCDLSFYTNQRLKRHIHVHTKTRPFNCKLCNTGYYNVPYLKAHYERVHGSEYLGAIKK